MQLFGENDYNFTIPNKYFRTSELASMFGISESSVSNFYSRYKIKPAKKQIKKVKKGGATIGWWDYSAYLKLKEWRAIIEERKVPPKKIEPSVKVEIIPKKVIDIEAERKAHPLVKDDRFFEVGFFPDVEPECFKDMEEV